MMARLFYHSHYHRVSTGSQRALTSRRDHSPRTRGCQPTAAEAAFVIFSLLMVGMNSVTHQRNVCREASRTSDRTWFSICNSRDLAPGSTA